LHRGPARTAVSAIVSRFAELRHADPRRILIQLPGIDGALSAADIWEAHLDYAQRLTQFGVGPDQLVVSASGNHPASVAFLLACRALRIVVMPVDAGTTLPEIRAIGDRFGAAALLLPSTMVTDRRPGEANAMAAGLHLVKPGSVGPRMYRDTAVLKLTSGSTASPKAALTSESQLIADGRQISEAMGIRADDTQIAAIPLSHSYGLGVLLMPLLLQGTAFVLRESFVPHQLPSDARRFGARVFPGVPFMFEYFIAHPPGDGWPVELRRLMSAGAPLTPATVRGFHDLFGVKIHSFYGTTETGGIAFNDSEDIEDGGAVGRPLPGVTITLTADPNAPPGAGRRIHVRSAAVASGYADAGEDGFDADGFLTGDYGTWDGGGRLVLAGRVSSFVNVAGRKVQPDEVEHVLRSMPGVADVRVLGAPDSRRGQQIVACIVPDTARRLSVLGVRRFCAARLAAYKIPRTIVFLDSIPLTLRGKTDRAALDALVRSRLGV
jgi:long-chain acyl-CoA synthetase